MGPPSLAGLPCSLRLLWRDFAIRGLSVDSTINGIVMITLGCSQVLHIPGNKLRACSHCWPFSQALIAEL